MSKISIIIPVYNAEKYIEKCLNSIINQTHKDLEILVVDNNSTDKSFEIIKQIANFDSRIKFFQQTIKGPGAARKMGLDNATGEYVMFSDADDWYQKNMCQKMVETIIKKKVDIVTCNANIIKVVGRNITDTYINPEVKGLVDFEQSDDNKNKFNIFLWNKIFKKSIIDKYKMTFISGYYRGEDNLFVWEYLSVSKNAFFLKDKLYNYQIIENTITDKILNAFNVDDKTLESNLIISEKLYEFLKQNNIFENNRIFFNKTIRENICYIYSLIGDFNISNFFDHMIPLANKISDSDLDYMDIIFLFQAIREKKYDSAKLFYDNMMEQVDKFKRKIYNNQPELTPAFTEKNIPIVLISDDNFSTYLFVAIESVISNVSPDKNYDIIVLTDGFSTESIKKFDTIILPKNVSLRIQYIQPYISKDDMDTIFNKPGSMRNIKLYIDRILPNYEKILYIDCDLVVESDLSELFNIDLGNNIVAAVRDLGLSNQMLDKYYKWYFDNYDYLLDTFNINLIEAKNYFNSGVMVMDLKKIRDENLELLFILTAKLNTKYWLWQDQSTLNACLKNRVLFLDYKWNYQVYTTDREAGLISLFANEKKIIHFLENKPLGNSYKTEHTVWWKYARMLPFYEQILIKHQTKLPDKW